MKKYVIVVAGGKGLRMGGRDSQTIHSGKRKTGIDAYAGDFSCL